jgi:stage II sporulation protein M
MDNKDFEYVYSLRKYILAVVAVFILSLITGLIVSLKNPSLPEYYLKAFENSYSWIKDLNPIEIMLIIFFNNAIKSLFALLLGLGLGIIPLLFIAGNGIIVSMLVDVVSRQHSVMFVAAAILPHGVIEIPMVLLSAGIGLRLGHITYMSIKGIQTDIRSELKQGILFYVRRITPMLFLAAMIETFVTPLIAFQYMT